MPPGVEVDRLEDPHVPGDRQRILSDEQMLERGEAVHRVARPDPGDALVGLDPDDGRRERPSRDRVPGCRERWVERQDKPLQADRGDAHGGSIAYRLATAERVDSGMGRQYRSDTPRFPTGG